ncbi:MAG TPA: hypothetical protein VNO32_22230, partial [Candidatus Acidoferrum sp.]|nr:hypothetical protein [Candidatus Acidoferrum sp.]
MSHYNDAPTWFRLSMVAALLLGGALLAYCKAPPPTAVLTGLVTSDSEGPMEGVLVTAKLEG